MTQNYPDYIITIEAVNVSSCFLIVFQKGLEELENHMTTGEMLLMKGDTRGQLDQIMNELTKVYHRFKARIHEYHILVKMTIQFFRNLDQVLTIFMNMIK